MKNSSTRIFAALLLMLSLSACALTEDSVAIPYVAPPNLNVIPDAKNVQVSVVAKDGRASNRDRVSSKKNGYGMELGRIVSRQDATDIVRGAVESELQSFGFVTGKDGIMVEVELHTFYADFKPGFFSADAVAEVAFNVSLVATDKSLVFAKSYKGIGINSGVLVMTGSSAVPPLRDALTKAMLQFVEDEMLQKALSALARKRAGKPVSNLDEGPGPAISGLAFAEY